MVRENEFPKGDYFFPFSQLRNQFGGVTRVVLSRIANVIKQGNRCVMLHAGLGRELHDTFDCNSLLEFLSTHEYDTQTVYIEI
jgi:hypothetical protein